MNTIHLRTDTYEDFLAACVTAGLVQEDAIVTSSHNHFIDLIGTLYAPTGNMLTDDEGNEYPEKEAISGYHANMRCRKPIGLEHLAVAVNNPLRKIA
jgi:hypothetical protein